MQFSENIADIYVKTAYLPNGGNTITYSVLH